LTYGSTICFISTPEVVDTLPYENEDVLVVTDLPNGGTAKFRPERCKSNLDLRTNVMNESDARG
jgi:hypothetical protein